MSSPNIPNEQVGPASYLPQNQGIVSPEYQIQKLKQGPVEKEVGPDASSQSRAQHVGNEALSASSQSAQASSISAPVRDINSRAELAFNTLKATFPDHACTNRADAITKRETTNDFLVWKSGSLPGHYSVWEPNDKTINPNGLAVVYTAEQFLNYARKKLFGVQG